MTAPVTEPTVHQVPADQLLAVWPHVAPGLAVALEESLEFASSEEILGRLLQGTYTLLVVVDDGQIRGSLVVELHRLGDLHLNLVLVHVEPGAHSGVLRAGIEAACQLGRLAGARTCHIFSARPGAARRARQLGFKPRFQEFIQEI